MFILVKLQDTIPVSPKYFNGNELQAIKLEIRVKYSNKVIKDVGLCCVLYDIVSIGDAFVASGDGSAHFIVDFRMVVFKPFVGEVLEGTVKAVKPSGVQMTMRFFDNIYVLATEMQIPSTFNEEHQSWVWNFQGHSLHLRTEARVRFRVTSVQFEEKTSARPTVDSKTPGTITKSEQPYGALLIFASMKDSGLGDLNWWIPKDNDSSKSNSNNNNEAHSMATLFQGEVDEGEGGVEDQTASSRNMAPDTAFNNATATEPT